MANGENMSLADLQSFSQNAIDIQTGEIVTPETRWLRKAVSNGLKALVAIKLNGTPEASEMEMTKEIWIKAFVNRRNGNWKISDINRIEAAFLTACERCEWWPQPKVVLDFLPPLKKQDAVNDKKSRMPANLKKMWDEKMDAARKREAEEKRKKLEIADQIKQAAIDRAAAEIDWNAEFQAFGITFQGMLKLSKIDFKDALKRILTHEQIAQLNL